MMRKIGFGLLLATIIAGAMAIATTARADCCLQCLDRWNNPHCQSWGWVDGRYPGGYVPPPVYGYPYATPYAGGAGIYIDGGSVSPYLPPVYETPPVIVVPGVPPLVVVVPR